MARILKLVFLLIISQVALGQAPSNYTNINGRYRWIAGMFDSTFHIPKGTTPSLRTGGSTNAGALFYKTGDSSLYVYSGTQWLKIAGASGFVPYVGATQDVDLDTWSAYAKSFHVKGTGGQGHFGLKFQSATPNMSANESGLYADALGNLGVKIDNSYTSIFKTSLNTANRTYTFQNKSYTIADSADVAAKIGGSGTTNYVAKFTALGTIGNSQIFDAGAAVGINTSTPSIDYNLDVNGQIRGTNIDGNNISSRIPSLGITMAAISRTGNLSTSNGILVLRNSASGTLQPASLYVDRTWTLPDKDGTVAMTSDLTGGTVTSVATNTATGITGGTITTSGTIAADTLLLSTRKWRQKGIDSVQGNLTSGLALKVNISDTASMLSPYLRSNVASATYVPQTRTITINGTSQDLSANRTYNVGTVTSVATSTGTGITGGTITSSGTIAADTLLLSTRAWRQKGVDSVAALVSGAVSGTTNYIPKFTSSSAIGNSILYQDGTTTIGIGISTPYTGSKLEVKQASTYDGIYVSSSTTARNSISLYNTGSLSVLESTYLGGGGSYTPISFFVSGSEGMRLTSTGLGIGTSSPAYKLDVNGSAALRASGALNLYVADNSNWSYIQNSGASTGTNNLGFFVSGATADLFISTAGRVGVGTISPAYKLDVSGNARISNSDAVLYINNTSASYTYALQTTGNVFRLYDLTANAERMRLDASGNLGLGVTPSAGWGSLFAGGVLQVKNASLLGYSNNLYLSANAYFTNSTDNYIASDYATRYVQASGQHKWETAPSGTAGNALSWTQAMTLDASGRLGIGTTSPAQRLTVKQSSTADETGGIALERNGNNARLNIYEGSSQWIISPSYSSGGSLYPILFTSSIGGANTLYLSTGGNVGIGTTSPGARLVISNSGALGYEIDPASSSGTEVSLFSYNRSTSAWKTTRYSALDHRFEINGVTEAMRITSGGNVGIGTTSPSEKLEVNGAIKTAAPSGGSAKPYKWGEAGVAIGGSNGYAVKVEIDGTLYYLMTGYLPEPEPEAASGPSTGYKSQFEQPVIKIKSDNQKIKDLEKEIAELKELIKSKIK